MTCGPTHYDGCARHESAWAAKLAAAGEVAFQSQNAAIDLVAQLEAAEERARRLGEALEEIVIHHADQVECWQDADDPDNVAYHREREEFARAALAPPPGDEKKGGG